MFSKDLKHVAPDLWELFEQIYRLSVPNST